MVRANMCDCCKEIYNNDNLKDIPVGKNTLKMCPECYNAFFKLYGIALEEIKKRKN